MQHKITSNFVPLSAIEHPRCPKCHGPRMMLAQISPSQNGYELRTFECLECNYFHEMVAPSDRLKSDALRWLSTS